MVILYLSRPLSVVLVNVWCWRVSTYTHPTVFWVWQCCRTHAPIIIIIICILHLQYSALIKVFTNLRIHTCWCYNAGVTGKQWNEKRWERGWFIQLFAMLNIPAGSMPQLYTSPGLGLKQKYKLDTYRVGYTSISDTQYIVANISDYIHDTVSSLPVLHI